MATPAGIEALEKHRETPSEATNSRDEAPTLDAVRSDSHGPGTDPDAALRAAIHSAVDAGMYERARALLDVLARTSEPAAVVDLRDRRR